MEQLPTPHNNFFHYMLSHLPSARSLMETQLSPKALAELDMATLRLETANFVDVDLREKVSDLLFSVQLAKSHPVGTANEALIYVLFEHKSQSDPFTVLQVLSYMIRVWEKRVRDGLPLCPILPLIVYHGESGWTAARSLAELIPVPAGLAEYQVTFAPLLLDLHVLPDNKIEGDPVLRSTLKLLTYSRSKRLVAKLRGILKSLVGSLPPELMPEWIKTIEVYVVSVNNNLDSQQYKQTLSSILPTQYEPGSLADRLLTQGRGEGLEEGLEIGELAGSIRTLQGILNEPITPLSELRKLTCDSLTIRLAELQQRLRDRPAQ